MFTYLLTYSHSHTRLERAQLSLAEGRGYRCNYTSDHPVSINGLSEICLTKEMSQEPRPREEVNTQDGYFLLNILSSAKVASVGNPIHRITSEWESRSQFTTHYTLYVWRSSHYLLTQQQTESILPWVQKCLNTNIQISPIYIQLTTCNSPKG